MERDDEAFAELSAYLRPKGKVYVSVLLYGLRPAENGPSRILPASQWPGGITTTCDRFFGQDSAVGVLPVVEMFDIHLRGGLHAEHVPYLKSALAALVEQGAAVSWLMFDGAFGGINPLFPEEWSAWFTVQVYGLCLPDRKRRLALRSASRQRASWARLLRAANETAFRVFPQTRLAPRSDPDQEPGTSSLWPCRVCGLLTDEPPWGETGTTPTYDFCACCGVEFGYQDGTPESARRFRWQWRENGATWDEPREMPAGWTIEDQLQNIPEGYR